MTTSDMPEDFDPIDPGDSWSTLDDLLGIEVVAALGADAVGDVAWYGRCSTEDNQDPTTSRGWQIGKARTFIEPFGGRITAEFFDVGQSRSVPWERRDHARVLLAELKNPHRGWNAIVVGEGTRCWYGNQFSLIAPLFVEYGVDLWVPELGGKYDPKNSSHKVLMSVLGGMSESERQHVQARVRASMDAQVLNEGRFQGGTAPYGYRITDAGPHPHPRKAALGIRLHKLEVDPEAARVVRRIFLAYLGNEKEKGKGFTAIAAMLNREGVPCPATLTPRKTMPRNTIKAWTISTIGSILGNPRYTGYAVFGRKTRHETLLDPDDVSAGYKVGYKIAPTDTVVRSLHPAHPAIVTVDEFTRVTLARRARNAGGMRGIAKLERTSDTTSRYATYTLRGRVRHDDCGRKMKACRGGRGHTQNYYRCEIREISARTTLDNGHPKSLYIAESKISTAVNGWLARLFAPEHRDATVRALVDSQQPHKEPPALDAIRHRLTDAETRLRRFRTAIAEGVNASAIAPDINQAESDANTARAELAYLSSTAPTAMIDAAEIHAMVDSLGNIAAMLDRTRPDQAAKLYADLGVQVRVRGTSDGTREAAVSVGLPSVEHGAPGTGVPHPMRRVRHAGPGCGGYRCRSRRFSGWRAGAPARPPSPG